MVDDGRVRGGFCSAEDLEISESKVPLSKSESIDIKKYLFPYPKIRNVQKDLIEEVHRAVSEKTHLVVHAPTGLGKTAATLAPALKYAIDHDKKIFFLTSRHTQHLIAIDTLSEIKDRYSLDFTAVDVIGKKWMCPVPGVETLYSNEFTEYCKKQREENKCDFFTNTKKGNKLTSTGKMVSEMIERESPCHVEKMKEICETHEVCTYEIIAHVARKASVVVADYYYIFNPWIRNQFFNKLDISLDDCIVIVDEGHNLPDRIRNLMTVQLTSRMIKRGITEAKKIEDDETIPLLARLQDVLNTLSDGMKDGGERIVNKNLFVEKVSKIRDYDDLVAELDSAANLIKKDSKQSSLTSISAFLDSWKGPDRGFVRIISQKGGRDAVTSLSYRCLDPSQVAGDAILNTHSTILMSGTLSPTSMYRNILGFPAETVEKEYQSPFPEANRLNLIVPATTTKFSQRNPEQFRRMAQVLADITDRVPGNSAVFFPSYYLRDQVYASMRNLAEKTIFLESGDMTKEDKMGFLDNFKAYQASGAVLLGVVSGSFGEGMDFPGDLLKCVVVVGLPLQIPTLETKSLIDYYDSRFGKGWEYGYVAPAFTKCLQSAGRCIRSETDRGLIVFLDERYRLPNYLKHFPSDWKLQVTTDYGGLVDDFFNDST